jgi:phospholipid-translocating ATPase
MPRSAIGHSTNLIGRESNIIIIRGGGEGATPIYRQMFCAVEEYFPNNDILSDPEVNTAAAARDTEANAEADAHDTESAPPRSAQLYPLRRVSSGVTSLVGSQNGQRPGGYILVIDGLALTDVGPSHFRHPGSKTLIVLTGVCFRLSAMSLTKTCFSVLRCCAMLWCAVAYPRNRRH